MKATAIATFRTKLRPDSPGTVVVRPGDVLDADEEHIKALARNRLVVVDVEEERETAVAPAPEKPEAPKPRRGKGKGKK